MFKNTFILGALSILMEAILLCGCNGIFDNSNSDSKQQDKTIENPADSLAVNYGADSLSSYEKMLIEQGMVDVLSIDSSIKVDLRYSTTNNFMNEDMYGDLTRCYLQRETAIMLSDAQRRLQQIDPNLSLVVFDGVRPREVQRKMWASGKLPKNEKTIFLADPELISLHNFGTAVDVSIIMSDGTLLDMGTEFDHIGELAYPSLESYFLDNGILGENQVENREILRKVMRESGFIVNKYEWWHFVSSYRKDALKKYAVIESFNTVIMPQQESVMNRQTADIVFRVQLAASSRKLSLKHPMLKGIDVKEYYHKGMYKYTSGEFNSLSATYEYRDSLMNRGYQAFVVCFNNGERIDIREAMNLMQ